MNSSLKKDKSFNEKNSSTGQKIYTTDNRVVHRSKSKDVNELLADAIGQKFIDYRKAWDKVNRYELETDFPLHIQLDMDQKCNLKCVQCPLQDEQDDFLDFFAGDNKLTWSDYKNIIAEGKEHNCPSIALTGLTEPLLDKNLEKYLLYAKDNNFMDIMINSNATLLTKERSKKLLDSGLTRIRFSIDAASTESFKIIRKGKYEKVIRNINNFLEMKEKGGYKLPVTGVNFVKMSLNEHEVDKFQSYWEDRVDMVSIQTYIPLNSEEYNKAYYPADQYGLTDQLEKFQCPQPFQRVVLNNRYITPCCAYDEELVFGEIGKDTIYDVWNGKQMKEIRAQHRDHKYKDNATCKACAERIYPEKTQGIGASFPNPTPVDVEIQRLRQ